jgi:hypothetical protein
LEEEGEPPGPFSHHEACAICDPEGDYNAEDDAEFLEYEKGPPDLWRCNLRDVKRGDTRQTRHI